MNPLDEPPAPLPAPEPEPAPPGSRIPRQDTQTDSQTTIPYPYQAIEPIPADTLSAALDTALVDHDNHVSLTFNIRFASDGSVPDLLNVWVGDRESVRDFKRRIQLLRPSLASRHLRLIYLGRVLTDGTLLVPWTELLLKRQTSQLSQTETVTRVLGDAVSGALGAVKGGYDAAIGVKSKGKGKEVEPTTTGGGTTQTETVVWLQCAVGEMMSPTITSETTPESDLDPLASSHAADDSSSQTRPLSGFDRLAEAGFSEEDIEQVRRQFHAEHEFLTSPTGFVDTDEEEHARAMEEQWLEGLNSTQDGVDNGMGTQIYSTLFKGLCIGFFFPIIPIFFFRTDLLDRRTQLAILSGSAINFLFGLSPFSLPPAYCNTPTRNHSSALSLSSFFLGGVLHAPPTYSSPNRHCVRYI